MSDTVASAPSVLVDEVPQGSAVPLQDEVAAVGNSSLLPDPRWVLIVIWRRLWIALAVFAIVMGTAIAYANLAPRLYTATASILIEPRPGDPVQQKGEDAVQAQSSEYVETQIVLLGSPQIASRVVIALGLGDDPQFAAGPPGESAAAQRSRLLATSQRLLGVLSVRRAGQTSVIEVTAITKSAGQSARIANEYVTQYLATIAEAKQTAATRMNEQIDQRLDLLRKDAEAADAALQNYKIAHGLMSSEGATMAEQESSTLNQQVAAARAALAERQGRLAAARQQLSRGGGGSDVSSALSSGTIGALRAQEAESSRNLAQLRSRYGAKHPSIAQEEQRLADVQRQIQAEIDRILSSLQSEVNVAQSGLNSLLGSQNQSHARLAGNAAAQVGYLELERKAQAARTVYEAFLNKSRGTAARDGIEQANASISSLATAPTAPSSPNVRLALLVGLLSALTASALAVAIIEFLDSRVKTKLDVERRLGARYLGAIPDLASTLDGLRNSEEPQDYVVSHPLSSFAEALRNLRASVTLRGNRRPKVIAICSALPREGKTTTAVSLARTLAMSGVSTVFVDCDVRRHSASDILLHGREGQLHQLLAGTVTLDAALLEDDVTDLKILGSCEPPLDGRDLLAPEAVAAVLAQLRERFDFIVIDTAPVLGIADARAVASQADVSVLIARWAHTSLRAADAALDLLIGARATVAGVALTQVDIRKFGSTGQEDVYGYHKKFKGYYVN